MFSSTPLIRALKPSKSETTAHISQDTWNKLHIAHMCWDDYVSDSTSFYRPPMNTVVQQAFTAEIRNIGLEHDHNKTKLQRISASGAHTIKKDWTYIQEPHLKGTVFEWEAPVDTQTLPGHHRKREHWSHAFGHLQMNTYAPYSGRRAHSYREKMRTRSKYNSPRRKSCGTGNMLHMSQPANPNACGASQTSVQTPVTTSWSR
jgi:hypothetical protein